MLHTITARQPNRLNPQLSSSADPNFFAIEKAKMSLPKHLKPNFESHFAKVNGVRLHYVEGGRGYPVLLIPGWPQTWYAWRYIMNPLSKSHKVIAVDPRGIGDSDKPKSGYDLMKVGAELVMLMRQLGYEKFAVVGHDIGMWISYAIAADHPQHVDRLAVIDAIIPGIMPSPPLFMQQEANKKMWHFAFNRAPEINELLVKDRERVFLSWQFKTKSHIKGAISSDDIDVYTAAYAAQNALRSSFDYYRAIDINIEQNEKRIARKLKIPVLAVGGKYAVGSNVERAMFKVAENVKGIVIENSGHYVPEEAPEELLKVLVPFLSN